MKRFGTLPSGEGVHEITLANAQGTSCTLMTYGAAITALRVPDRRGALGNVVLGFDDLDSYVRDTAYHGAIVGRVANRTGNARFELEGKEYGLQANNGTNHLHGGRKGFDKVVWEAEARSDARGPAMRFRHVSPAGDEGYPGTLEVEVTYLLTEQNELRIEYVARTDAPTPVNLTNHAYFNLAGRGSVLGYELWLNSSAFTPVGSNLIPTGELLPVEGTPMDFRRAKTIGNDFDRLSNVPRGYDHNFAIDGGGRDEVIAGRVIDPESGRVLEVRTDQPGIQVYTGNFLDGSTGGRGGSMFERHSGLCLETQDFPDAINQPNFPSIVLRPGETYETATVYAFKVSGTA